MDRPTFVILPEPIPVSELPEILGKFVVDYFSPLDISAPKKVSDVTKPHELDKVVAEELSVVLNSIQDSSALARLQSVLELSAKKGWNQKLKIESSKVETHRLKNHDQVFETIMGTDDKAKEIEKLFKHSKSGMIMWRKQAYMIVGVKVITDSTVTFERTDKQSKDAKGAFPANKVADALAPGCGRRVPNPEVAMHAEEEFGQTLHSKAKNQQEIFAVEYRVITRSTFVKKTGADATKMGAKKRFNWGNGMMGDDDDEDMELDELSKETIETPAAVFDVLAGDVDFWFQEA